MDLSVATGRKQTATDSCAGAGRKCPRSGILLMVSLDATELQLMISFIRTRYRLAALFCLALASALPLRSQENYIVTYSHELEEPGNLELAAKNVTGAPKGGNPFVATALECEYGVKTWW